MFSALKRVRAYEQIADEVRERILKGLIRPGDKLPGERELAGQFGVNRSTVREAMKSLAELGLVVVRHGGGAVVQDYAARAGLQILPYLFSSEGGNPDLLVSLLESRRLFAVELTRLAVERATEEEQEELAALVAELAAAARGGDVDAVQRLDFEIVESLARASHNAVFLLIMNSVRPVYEQQRAFFRSLYAEPEGIAAAYGKIAACFEGREAERAAKAMEAVMRAGEAHVQDILRAGGLLAGSAKADAPGPRARGKREGRGTHRRR